MAHPKQITHYLQRFNDLFERVMRRVISQLLAVELTLLNWVRKFKEALNTKTICKKNENRTYNYHSTDTVSEVE